MSIPGNILIFDNIDAAGKYTVNNENKHLELMTYSGNISRQSIFFVRNMGKDFPSKNMYKYIVDKSVWKVNLAIHVRENGVR